MYLWDVDLCNPAFYDISTNAPKQQVFNGSPVVAAYVDASDWEFPDVCKYYFGGFRKMVQSGFLAGVTDWCDGGLLGPHVQLPVQYRKIHLQ